MATSHVIGKRLTDQQSYDAGYSNYSNIIHIKAFECFAQKLIDEFLKYFQYHRNCCQQLVQLLDTEDSLNKNHRYYCTA